MRCANPKCNAVMMDTQGGTMRLLELDIPPEARIERGEWGFPVLCVPTRYFWLCEDCSRLYRIRRWTTEGLRLEPVLVVSHSQENGGKAPARRPVASHGAIGRAAKIA